MKHKFLSLFIATVALTILNSPTFASVTINGIAYELNGTTATVVSGGNYTGTIVIPSSVTFNSVTYSVTSIGYAAFSFCTGLTSVTVPNSVTSIGQSAFRGCTGLTSVTIGNSVTSIGMFAFLDCGSLTSPVYNTHVFAYMPTSYSGAYTIPDGIESIGYGAFENCIGLTVVTIPNSVSIIGSSAFRDCSGLTSVTIPGSVTSIGRFAFSGCSGLTFPVYNAHVFAFMPTSYSGAYTIPDGIESIAGSAFSSCTGLTSVTIPNSVTSIGSDAFSGCTGLISVTIPNSVTSIGDGAFRACTGLASITIPNSVTSIGSGAFSGCTGLTSVTIPNSVTSIGGSAFSGCSGLTSVTIPNSVTSIGGSAFSGCTGLTSVTIPNSVTSIGSGAFSGCTGLTSVTIPNSVTSIGTYAFLGCTGLTSVTIGDGVTSIGEYAFYQCSGLTSPVYNTHVFAYMPTSYSGAYTIPDGIESIAGGAFQDCTGLTSLTIPNSVTSIGGSAFNGCTGLTAVTMEAETPPTLGSFALDYTNDCPIYVPCGTLEAYKTAWAGYASRIKYGPLEYQITGNVNIEGAGSVQLPQNKCEDVISATPNYGYHFVRWRDGNTDNPRTFVLTQDTTFTAEFAPDRVGTCGKDLALVWSYDPTNKVLTIGNAGEFTENMQFGLEAPGEMEELVIGNSVTAIGENAFAGIETLKKVSIGESVKTIGEQAFYNCVNLETIFNYRPTPTNTYSNAFDGVDKFECALYVLPSSIDMYKAAAVWRDFYYTYAIGAEEATVTTNDVTVEPQDNAATVTWPTNDNAATYTIQITKDGEVFCTLIFNANGQLTGIAFAPSRDGQAHAPQALMTANGMQFTVTGLDSGTHYALILQAKDSQETVLASYSSEFTTTGQNAPQGLDEISSSLQGGDRGRLIYHDGQIFILRGEKIYTVTGQEVK